MQYPFHIFLPQEKISETDTSKFFISAIKLFLFIFHISYCTTALWNRTAQHCASEAFVKFLIEILSIPLSSSQ